MRDRFRGKTWIFWAQFIGCGAFAVFGIIFGFLFWTGAMTDANGETRPQAGPPLFIVGCCLLPVTALAGFNIAGRIAPVIRCYRDGIECNLIGVTSIDGLLFIPKLGRLAWTILSLQGFRSQRIRIPWSQFIEARVGGIPMAYVLTLNGNATNVKTGQVWPRIVFFKQVALRDHPQEIADTLNQFAAEPFRLNQLPDWSADSAKPYTDSP